QNRLLIFFSRPRFDPMSVSLASLRRDPYTYLMAGLLIMPAFVALDNRALGQEQRARQSERVDLGSVNALAFSPNGKLLDGAHEDGFRLRHLTTGKELVRADRRGTFAVAFSSDSKTIAMGMADGTIRLWPTDAKVESGKLTGHKEGVTTVAFAPDGK